MAGSVRASSVASPPGRSTTLSPKSSATDLISGSSVVTTARSISGTRAI